MDPYVFSLLLGGAGLGTMALSGLGARAGGGRGHARGHARGHVRGHAKGHHVKGHAKAQAKGHAKGSSRNPAQALWVLTSPTVLFSVFLGLGATGLLLRPVLGGAVLAGVAVLGGLLFERLAVRPVWNFFLRFASAPALTLEACVEEPARAVSSFDANGHGLVAVELDGQVVQVLGTLAPNERAAGIRVRAGDRVRIAEVDVGRNRCTVSAL